MKYLYDKSVLFALPFIFLTSCFGGGVGDKTKKLSGDYYYRVDGSSKERAEERQARIDDLKARASSLNDEEFLDAMEELENEENDFSVWGDIIDPKFETDVMAELNKWLLRQGIR